MDRKRIGLAIAALSLALAGGIAPARAASLIYASGPGEQFRGYTLPVLVVRPGDSVTYLNGDIAYHDVHGEDDGSCPTLPGTCPRFASPLIGLSQSADVAGIPALAPGTYGFVCTIHGSMKGTLVVSQY